MVRRPCISSVALIASTRRRVCVHRAELPPRSLLFLLKAFNESAVGTVHHASETGLWNKCWFFKKSVVLPKAEKNTKKPNPGSIKNCRLDWSAALCSPSCFLFTSGNGIEAGATPTSSSDWAMHAVKTEGVGSAVRREDEIIRFTHVPSYAEFRQECLLPNRPCILPPGLVAHWSVVRSNAWASSSCSSMPGATGEETQTVDWEALKQLYGTHTAPVVITRTDPSSNSTTSDRSDLSISHAVDLIRSLERGELPNVASIYIKDWHLVKQSRSQASQSVASREEPYTVPEIFADDWMNNLSSCSSSHEEQGEQEEMVDDFRFCYAGTAASSTLLHRDVYTSYSWSTNVVGVKRWWLFPPHVIPSLRRFPGVDTSPLIEDVDTLLRTLSSNDRGKEYRDLNKAYGHMQVITQRQGETIFIPSNWYHQVENLTDCISINRNWCNAHNLPSLYHSIVEELHHAEESLCDVKDMLRSSNPGKAQDDWKPEFYALVQDIAIKDAGWAWAGFWQMVERNLISPATGTQFRPQDDWVKQRLLPLIDDFQQRQDARWLDPGIRETAQRCKALLER